MEKDRYNDPLDDYVRKSFEEYEEDPAPDMWDRVEGELEPAGRVFWLFRWPTMATTVVLLLCCGLLGGHFYSEGKMSALTAEQPMRSTGVTRSHPVTPSGHVLSEHAPDRAQSSDTIRSHPGTFPSSPTNAPQLPESFELSGSSARMHGADTSSSSAPVLQNIPQTSRFDNLIPTWVGIKSSDSVRNGAGIKVQIRGDGIVAVEARGNLPTVSPDGNTPLPNQSNNHFTATNTYPAENPVLPNDSLNTSDLRFSQAPVVELKPPDPRIFQLETIQQHPLLPAAPPIQPARTPSSWYVGLHLMPNSTFEKNTAATTGRPRLTFTSEPQNPDFSTDGWLKVGKKISPRFGLESGVGYRATSATATHTAVLQFRDGSPLTPVSRTRNFRYNLDTYSGPASVSLRMEPADNGPVADTELLRVKIMTIEQVQLVRIPLLAVFRVGSGRLQGTLKAGATGNFFLRNQLNISMRTSQTSRFRPSPDSGSFSIQLDQPKQFFAGYWLSGGLEWKWSRHISLVAEPCFSGNFARKDANGRRLPDQVSLGGNVGVNYGF